MANISEDDIHALRQKARARRAQQPDFGMRAADWVAATVGSWRFILIQSAILIAWVSYNAVSARPFDPMPFILLNLLLSFQAAYTAPIIMMSQNRQSDIDRTRSIQDFDVNRKAELEIELLHQKIDAMREQELAALAVAVERLSTAIATRKD